MTPLESAWLRYKASENGLELQAVAEAAGMTPAHLRRVLAQTRGITEATWERVRSLISSENSDNDQLDQWTSTIQWGDARRATATGGEAGLSPATPTRYAVVMDGVTFTAKAVCHPFDLVSYCNKLIPLRSQTAVPFELGGHRLVLQASKEEWIPAFERGWRRALEVRAPDIDWAILAKLSIGAYPPRCPNHSRLRGPHKRGGKWSCGCAYEARGERCPANHYVWLPRHCVDSSPDDDAHQRRCPKCRELQGEGCPDCIALRAAAPDLGIEVTGMGCTLGLAEPLVQQLLSRFSIPASVVRHEIHLALDLEADAASLIPVALRGGPGRRYQSAESEWNADCPPGIYLGGGRDVTMYAKLPENLEHGLLAGKLRRPLPRHVVTESWNDDCTRLEFRIRNKARGANAKKLEFTKSPWSRVALADFGGLDKKSIEAEVMLWARKLGFVGRAPSLKRWLGRRKRILGCKTKRRFDLGDAMLANQKRGDTLSKERNAAELANALQDLLEELPRPLDVATVMEAAVPALEAQLARALTPPPPKSWALPATAWEAKALGLATTSLADLPGVPAWRIESDDEPEGFAEAFEATAC